MAKIFLILVAVATVAACVLTIAEARRSRERAEFDSVFQRNESCARTRNDEHHTRASHIIVKRPQRFAKSGETLCRCFMKNWQYCETGRQPANVTTTTAAAAESTTTTTAGAETSTSTTTAPATSGVPISTVLPTGPPAST